MFLRKISLIITRSAGHSKWQNIRHTKSLKDAERSAVFSKMGHRIKVCIQENGNNANPDTNAQLAHLISYAKKCGMPLTTIQSFIRHSKTDKETSVPYRISIKGPKGSILLVTTLTNSTKKTQSDLRGYLKKVGGIVSDQSLEGSFDKKGVILAQPPAGANNIEESSVDHAIEAGAEEVLPLDENNKLTFCCEVSQLHKVKTKLEEFNYVIEDLKLTYIPKMKVSLNDDEMELMSRIIARLEDFPDVVEIHDNIE